MKEQNYYFTFCGRHPQARQYVKIYGTYQTAREEMSKRYGEEWGFQYPENEFDEAISKYNLEEIQ